MEPAPPAALPPPDDRPPGRARIHRVPATRTVTVEHPCIIKNFDAGIRSLGGEAQLKHVLEHHVHDSKLSSKQNELPEPVAGVSLRPDDPFAKKIPSLGASTRNVLVRVTLPKRTGRRRKRGTNEPYRHPPRPESPPAGVAAPCLLQRLRDTQGQYDIEAIGVVRETHRFRSLPDFQLRSAELPMMRKLRDHTMRPQYDRLAEFRVDLSRGNHGITAFPGPPSFTSFDMPHKYEYQQAPGVVFVQDGSGQVTSKNTSAPAKRLTWGLAPDAPKIPEKPPTDIPMRSPNGDLLAKAIRELDKLLQNRPLLTKRVALNSMDPISDTTFKEATQYVGYSFKAGPWRDSLIKYGVDPRKDAKFRFYQTLMFQVDKEAFREAPPDKSTKSQAQVTNTTWARPLRHTRDAPESHIFDGQNVTANGKTWQVCDVTDPIVRDIFETEDIRTECDPFQWGWYHNGTLAKARTIMKDKMRFLFAKEEPPHEDYKKIAAIPDRITQDNMREARLSAKEYGHHASALSNEVRTIVKSGQGERSAEQLWTNKKRLAGEQADDEEGGSVMDEENAAEPRDLDVADDDVGDMGENRDEDEEDEDEQAQEDEIGDGQTSEIHHDLEDLG